MSGSLDPHFLHVFVVHWVGINLEVEAGLSWSWPSGSPLAPGGVGCDNRIKVTGSGCAPDVVAHAETVHSQGMNEGGAVPSFSFRMSSRDRGSQELEGTVQQ